jgi:peptidoglycan hydrolase-like protein with peptidoglycan-binding domain
MPRIFAIFISKSDLMSADEKRKKVVDTALGEVGNTETPPNSNKTKYGAWYGINGVAWCAEFVSWVFNEAGAPLGKVDDDKGYRYCPSAYNFWKAHNQITTHPEPGDIVLFDWTGDGKADHTGIFYKDNGNGKTFTAVEGNTAIGNDSNGGTVMIRKDRHYSCVKAFVKPAIYSGEVVAANTDHDLKKGDKGSAINELQKKLKKLNYNVTIDGDFGKETEKAIKTLQKDNKLSVTGIVTPQLMGVLDMLLVPKPAPDKNLTTGAYLKRGDKGINVTILQKALNKNGSRPKLIEDGDFGNATKKAVSVFQKKNNLTADGVAGPITLSKLKVKL